MKNKAYEGVNSLRKAAPDTYYLEVWTHEIDKQKIKYKFIFRNMKCNTQNIALHCYQVNPQCNDVNLQTFIIHVWFADSRLFVCFLCERFFLLESFSCICQYYGFRPHFVS